MIVDPDFCDHWKTRMLVGSLNDEAAPVYVLRLWAHCQNRRQSNFDNVSPEALKALCRFPGPANKLESSLTASGFVRRNEDGSLVVCGWDEYNSSLIAAWSNGMKGGRPKKTQTKPTGIPSGNPQGNPNETDKSREDKRGGDKKLKTDKKIDLTDQFGQWWRVYPKRVGKDAAALAYSKAVAKIATADEIPMEEAADLLLRLTRERIHVVNSFEEKYRPHPATWLNRGHYNDEVAAGSESRVATVEERQGCTP